eukprot:TRINITY_DN13529_c0_g1_i3.p1 TRINITY_DN13529_c0_g1~~TRINITY_DN13529_c0_g1_i3.p1  ORF type:complete len:206 (-),score=-8.33 TRINITY_DN13529_c0_g1_i3:218-769(-)
MSMCTEAFDSIVQGNRHSLCSMFQHVPASRPRHRAPTSLVTRCPMMTALSIATTRAATRLRQAVAPITVRCLLCCALGGVAQPERELQGDSRHRQAATGLAAGLLRHSSPASSPECSPLEVLEGFVRRCDTSSSPQMGAGAQCALLLVCKHKLATTCGLSFKRPGSTYSSFTTPRKNTQAICL